MSARRPLRPRLHRAAGTALLLALGGCAGSGPVNPNDDSLATSFVCTFTDRCTQYVDALDEELENERQSARQLATERAASDAELTASERELSALRDELAALEQEIASLRRRTAEAREGSSAVNAELAEVEAELERLERDSSALEEEVLLERIDVPEAESRKRSLEQTRDRLEQLLLDAL